MNIRKIELTDADSFFCLIENNRDHLSTYFPITINLTKDLPSTRRFIEDKIINAVNKENLYFVIEMHDQLIGVVSIKNIDWAVPKCEIAYFIDKDSQGKGIASNAVKWLMEFCFGEFNMEKIYAKISPINDASKRVVEKNGFSKGATLKNDFRDGNNALTDSEYYELSKQTFSDNHTK